LFCYFGWKQQGASNLLRFFFHPTLWIFNVRQVSFLFLMLFALGALACGNMPMAIEEIDNEEAFPNPSNDPQKNLTEPECEEDLPYARRLINFTEGSNAGFGQSELPDIVLGPPETGSPASGAMHVLSLGIGGEIILSFGEQTVFDGEGPDLIIWENAFWEGGDPNRPFAELGEVSVSMDGDTWHVFPCEPDLEEGYDNHCAGWRPRLEYDPCTLVPLKANEVGGDAFDLADLELTEIRYVRIRDLATSGGAPSAGFDLDAVGAVYLE
jgi:hypothetical protein